MLNDFMSRISFQKRALDASSLRHDVISNNIANIETPNYKRREVVFEKILQNSINNGSSYMKLTHKNHMNTTPETVPYIKVDNSFSHRIDGNNVNIDVEMAEQAKNSVKYNALVQQLSSEFKRMKMAIKGGR